MNATGVSIKGSSRNSGGSSRSLQRDRTPHVGATPSSVPKDNSDGGGGGIDILLGICLIHT